MGIGAFFKKLTGQKTVETVAEPAVVVAVTPTPQAPVAPAAPVIPVKPKAAPPKPVSPLALTGGAKHQSDWLLLQIGKTGRAFMAVVPGAQIQGGGFVRHDMTAALLGYRLVLTAYHFHQDVPSLEALRFVRTAMIGMLHRAVDITVEKNGSRDQRAELLASAEEQFKNVDKEIAEACIQLRGHSTEPFAGFYASLSPAFGNPERYGAVLKDLYGKIESAMAARNHHRITG